MQFIGLDAGSVSVKVVLLDENGTLRNRHYERHRGHPLPLALQLLTRTVGKTHSRDFSLSVTGSAGRLIASALGIGFTNELVAQAFATQRLYPHVKTIFELGGEDSKLIILGDRGIKDFSMNSVCAAGTGSFLDQQAERLRLSIEEFSDLAAKAETPSRVAGRCSVFAKSDMIHLQQIATPFENIVAGLCFAVARNFRGAIVRGRTVAEPVSFHGGVAANAGMVRAFKNVFGLRDLLVPAEYALMGALGASLKDQEEGLIHRIDLERLRAFTESSHFSDQGHAPLIAVGDDFHERHPKERQGATGKGREKERGHSAAGNPLPMAGNPSPRVEAYMGIDVGSISTNLAVIDRKGSLLAKRYLMTAGRPIEAVRQGLREIADEIGGEVEIMGVGTTGSGRYMIADFVGADIVKNEITAQATAAAFIDRHVDTIFEIGGQDSKYISLRDGVIVDFEMNKACAAGTGSFLEEQSEKLSIPIKGEFEDCAFSAAHPCRLGERCTVFMENSLMANLQKGAEKNSLLAGLAYSIVQNYLNKVVAGRSVGTTIFFQGGVAFNKSVVAAFEKFLGKKITVPPHHDVTGAIGMALIAMRHRQNNSAVSAKPSADRIQNLSVESDPLIVRSSFKGFELSRRSYEISSFTCRGCPNVCEINKVKVEGEEGNLFYGGRCEKYDIGKAERSSALPDLFAFREDMLWREHLTRQSAVDSKQSTVDNPTRRSPVGSQRSVFNGSGRRPTVDRRRQTVIGIPYIFFFHDYLPFWTAFLWELGFAVEVSPKTSGEIVRAGIESVLADTCFPIKVAHGHIKHLVDKGVDALFIPSFINMATREGEIPKGYGCPLTQTIPYAARIAHPGVKVVAPVIDLCMDTKSLAARLKEAFEPFRIGRADILRSLAAAERPQEDFFRAVREKGAEVLSSLTGKAVVIVGRSYNALDGGVNLSIPKKLSDLGVLPLPMDFIPLDEVQIDDRWPNMYWRSGQKILKAARIIRTNPHLYAVFIGNFSCGPDSFILKYFAKEMSEKPFLHIEIDEHSADAGAITRCEAFLDSIEHRKEEAGGRKSMDTALRRPSKAPHSSRRTVYIPRMSDHAFALAAAFEKCGLAAEVLPESDKETAELGRKYVSGKECYPCTVTTGDMLRKVFSPGFRSGESAFFMPSGSGPCRFGQYNVFHRMTLDDLGYPDVPILSPNQDMGFYRELGLIGSDYPLHAWKGIIAIELLCKCLHEKRPYEKEKGAADRLHEEYLKKLYRSLRGADGKIEPLLGAMKRDFENLATDRGRRPLVGIVGEIFVRSHRFSNEDLVRKVEALGGEVWLAPVEEWIYYVNRMGLRKALIKKDKSAIIELLLKTFFQKRTEHRYARYFSGFLKTLKEPDTKTILEKAAPYIHDSFEGEAVLSIGKSIDLIERGISGIINAMPFGCMPGTIVTTLMRGVSRDYGVPCISVPYDGTESSTTAIQLEAFMNQVKGHKKR